MTTSAHPPCDTETPDTDVETAFDGPARVYDSATLVELEGVFGRVRLLDLLAHLKDEIAKRLVAPDTDRNALRSDAHMLLSASGSLGFFELSRLCVAMEQACLVGADLVAPLSAARAAAQSAIAAIGEIETRAAGGLAYAT